MLRQSPAFVVLVIVIADALQLADPDLWSHLRAGQIILSTRHLILYDQFSYTAFGQLWRNHEWLLQVVMAALYDHLDVFGLKLLKLLCAAATISFIALGMAETVAPARVQRALLLVIALALVAQIEFRPQIATYALLSLLMALLARDTYGTRVRLWPLIPMFALWANLHGGYAVGLAGLATYTAVVAVDTLRQRQGWGRGIRLAAITAACALATLANPEGTTVWRTFTHTVTNPVLHNGVAEWQPLLSRIGPEWHAYPPGVIIYLLPLALFVALAVSVLLTPTMDDAALVAIAALFIIGAFVSCRNMALAVIALTIPLAHHAGIAMNDASSRRIAGSIPKTAGTESERLAADPDRPFNPLLAGGLAIVIAVMSGLLSNRLAIDQHCPVDAVAFMKKHDLHGNVLGYYDWGNYLLWHVAPESKIFIDGRCDQVYSTRVATDYFDFDFGRPGAESILDKYPNDFVLMPPDSKAYAIVGKNPGWKLIYRDLDAGLFARAGSAAARLFAATDIAPQSDKSPPEQKLFP